MGFSTGTAIFARLTSGIWFHAGYTGNHCSIREFNGSMGIGHAFVGKAR
jgi:hypothetical protein